MIGITESIAYGTISQEKRSFFLMISISELGIEWKLIKIPFDKWQEFFFISSIDYFHVRTSEGV